MVPLFPPCVPSRADPSGLGNAATIYSSVQGPPGVETPIVVAPGRGLLRVNEQLHIKLQIGSLQQPLFRDAAPFQESRVHVPRRQLRHGAPSSVARQRQRRPSARPAAAESTTSSPRGRRTASGSIMSPSPPQEEEAGQPWPRRGWHLVGCRASRRRRRPSGGHVRR
jgi:hypothetical protein